MDRLFFRGWVFIGHESEIPLPGDFVTRPIGTQPVIMARAMDGQVSVMVNRCAHRGTMVCSEARGNTRTFACPYHGWTYDLTGELLGVPYPTAYDGRLDKKTKSLGCDARVGSYRGFVFACLGPTSVTLEQHLGVATGLIDRACDLSPEGEVQLTAGWVKHRCSSNWKMLPENDLDGYHLGFVHMALFKSVRTQYNRFTGDEKSVKGVVRDWGNGHTEIDWSPAYDGPFEWFGTAASGVLPVARRPDDHGPQSDRAALATYGMAGAEPWRSPRARGRRGPPRLAPHGRDDEPGVLPPVPQADDGRIAR